MPDNCVFAFGHKGASKYALGIKYQEACQNWRNPYTLSIQSLGQSYKTMLVLRN